MAYFQSRRTISESRRAYFQSTSSCFESKLAYFGSRPGYFESARSYFKSKLAYSPDRRAYLGSRRSYFESRRTHFESKPAYFQIWLTYFESKPFYWPERLASGRMQPERGFVSPWGKSLPRASPGAYKAPLRSGGFCGWVWGLFVATRQSNGSKSPRFLPPPAKKEREALSTPSLDRIRKYAGGTNYLLSFSRGLRTPSKHPLRVSRWTPWASSRQSSRP